MVRPQDAQVDLSCPPQDWLKYETEFFREGIKIPRNSAIYKKGNSMIDKAIKKSFDDIYYPESIIDTISNGTDEKMVDHIRRVNQEYLDDTALLYFGLEISFGEMFEQIDGYARALKSAGMDKGDCITTCLPNLPETIYYIYACNEIGATAYPIDPRYTFGKIKTCIEDSHSKMFVIEESTFFAKVAMHENEINVEGIVVVSPSYSFLDRKNLGIKQRLVKMLIRAKEKRMEKRIPISSKTVWQKDFLLTCKKYNGKLCSEYDPDFTAIIVNTSGTSGDSVKGAEHTDKSYNILANQTKVMSKEVVRGYLYYGYIPFFSMYGSSVGMHNAITNGIVLDIIPKFDARKSVYQIVRKMPNILVGVPDLYEVLVSVCKRKKKDMSFAKLYVMGGDNVSPEKLRQENETLSALGMPHRITFGYGLSEAMVISTYSDDERSYEYGSCGIPYPGVSYLIMDPDTGQIQNNGVEGEICVNALTMMKGYLNRPEENDSCFVEYDGVRYFKTGDKGYVSAGGHLYIVGRYKRLMKRPDGHQVSPIPIENAIMKHPKVKDCCVVGVKRNKDESGVIPTAFISLEEGLNATDELVKNIAQESLQQLSGEREAALAYVKVDRIPYNENGKMDYRMLEERGFGEVDLYVVEDMITKKYFKGMSNVRFIKL